MKTIKEIYINSLITLLQEHGWTKKQPIFSDDNQYFKGEKVVHICSTNKVAFSFFYKNIFLYSVENNNINDNPLLNYLIEQ